jgi:SecD/SecF fusion protein
MENHLIRSLAIAGVLILALVHVYPTIGWMTLSDVERIERRAQVDDINAETNDGIFSKQSKAIRRWLMFDPGMVINLGLDLQGGIDMVIGVDMNQLSEADLERYRERQMTDAEIQLELQRSMLRLIELRISEFEAKEPIIQSRGTNQIQIQLPGEKDITRAKDLIMRAAVLTFHITAQPEATTSVIRSIEEKFPSEFTPYLRQPGMGASNFRVPEEHIDRIRVVVGKALAEEGLIPEDLTVAFGGAVTRGEETEYEIYVMNREPDLSGEGIRQATAQMNTENLGGGFMVLFENTTQAAIEFSRVTTANINRPMAIAIDGVILSDPVINGPIGASGQITGSFTQLEAQDLAIALNSGSLPVKPTEDFSGIVGASLGAQSVKQGVTSAIIGVVLVMVFMLIFYMVSGVIANIALLANAVLVLGALAYANATLTLPGIAGLILTVGMAVDANVLIFERIREEIRNGKSILGAIDSGFSRASVTILDANVTTLIAAAVLLQFGTGPIESFAITLSIGVVTSVFTALIVSRSVFDFLANRKMLTKLKMMSIIKPETKVPFMNWRKPAFMFSVVALIAGLGMFAARGGDNFGVDFTTGTNMVIHFPGSDGIDVNAVRGKLEDNGYADSRVQEYSSEAVQNGFSIHIGGSTVDASAGADEAVTAGTVDQRVRLALAELVTDSPDVAQLATLVPLERGDTVGPAVGEQLKWDALKCIFFALLCIVAYLWYRFELKFAFGAVIALVHDVLITLGAFAIFGRELSLPVVAALLTIIGYSLNDTIVVFDRIREDMKLYRGRDMSLAEIMSISINQTLSRTLLTSLTTLFVVTVLFIFGGEAIRDFAFALICGVIVGTYSSIFVASPSVYYIDLWEKARNKNKGPEDEGPGSRRRRKGKGKGGNQVKKEATA